MRLAVWDLDETLLAETLLERDPALALPVPDPVALDLVRSLSLRGIVNAIATRNSPKLRGRLAAEPWASDFVAIHAAWGDKAAAVAALAEELGFALGDTAYVDRDPF